MLKGGFGLIDAPNLFTKKVGEVFIAIGAKPTMTEPKIYLKAGSNHETVSRSRGCSATSAAAPVLMISAHMDDFKATGARSELNWVRETLSRACGGDVNMSQEEVFIHTGIRHSRIQEKNESDFHFALDQNE